MWENIFNNSNAILELLEPISHIIGLILLVKSIFKMAAASNKQPGATRSAALGLMIVSVLFLSLPSFIETLTETAALDKYSSLFGMPSASKVNRDMLVAIFAFLKVVGVIAIIRSFWLTKEMIEHNKNLVWPAFWHSVGGVLLFHMDKTIVLFADLLGFKL